MADKCKCKYCYCGYYPRLIHCRAGMFIKCEKCYTAGPIAKDISDAVDGWNEVIREEEKIWGIK